VNSNGFVVFNRSNVQNRLPVGRGSGTCWVMLVGQPLAGAFGEEERAGELVGAGGSQDWGGHLVEPVNRVALIVDAVNTPPFCGVLEHPGAAVHIKPRRLHQFQDG
jgi:hypothetical protein